MEFYEAASCRIALRLEVDDQAPAPVGRLASHLLGCEYLRQLV